MGLALIAALATPASAQRVGAAPAGVRPGVAPNVRLGVAPNVRPGVMPNVRPGVNPQVRPGAAPNVRPNVRPGVDRGTGLERPRFGRLARFRRDGSYGLDAVGLGIGLAGDVPPFAPADEDDDYGYGPPRAFPLPPPRCPHPLIIAIGAGLRHPARTRVVYGAPPTCVP